jgi:tetratricopeptide (TPR) repeat protein
MEEPLRAEEHLDKAYELEEAGRFEEALAECDAAIEATEAFLAHIFNLRGIILERLEREEEAVSSYATATQLDPSMAEAADNLFELEAELGKGWELVTIAAFSFPAQAHVVKGRLEAEGIRAFVVDEELVTANWLYSGAVGGVKVKVREGDVERALDILGMEALDEEA